MAGLGEVSLIHGKGTGVLRKAINDMLKRHPHVKSYRLGEYGEGGTGVTVVQLK
ncbi:Endonuclease MutS2 [compost metagenome]